MAHGKKTGGKRKGSLHKRTVAKLDAFKDVKKKIEKALGKGAFDGDAHTLMVAVYKDQSLPLPIRLDAAKAAAPYEKPRLSTTQHSIGSIAADAKEAGLETLKEVRQLIKEEMERA